MINVETNNFVKNEQLRIFLLALIIVIVLTFSLTFLLKIARSDDSGDGGGCCGGTDSGGGGGDGGGGSPPPPPPPPPFCGDGIVNNGETCELPNTVSNPYCAQNTTACSGTQTGTRGSLGNCNGACGCVQTPFNYACVKGSCGAQCAVNSDCPENTTACNGNQTGTRDSLGICNSQCGCTQKSFNFSCVRDSCGAGCNVGDNETRNVSCNTNQGCPGTLLQRRYCQGSSCQFGNWQNVTSCQDTPGDNCPGVCGDGIIQNGETCEPPNTLYNPYCSETTTSCSGNKTGTRNAFGNCNSNCGCVLNPFNYNCLIGSCGATCSSNSDCQDQCLNSQILQTSGRCGTTSCSCSYTRQDCSQQSGWFDTGVSSVGPCADDTCKTCGFKEQEFRNFFCGDSQCSFVVTDHRNVQVNRTVIKCPIGTFCSDGSCIPKTCQGDIKINSIIQVCAREDPRVYISGLNLYCYGYRVYLKSESCDGPTLGTCVINRLGQCVRNVFFKEIGTPTVFACLDKNKDGDFNDPGEQTSLTFNVNCNNCVFSACPIGLCTKCYKCSGYNTNPYSLSTCLNPDQSCAYSCLLGSCGARSC